MRFSLDNVRSVAHLLQETNLAEISIETANGSAQPYRLRVRRDVPPRPAIAPPAAVKPAQPAGATATITQAGTPAITSDTGVVAGPGQNPDAGPQTVNITATAVGLFRHQDPPLQVGDTVRAKQVIGSVESLKVPNDVCTPVAGKILEVLVEEGQGVEYGQLLMTVEPAPAE